jgi:endonuclease/exonuclease/phosphatase family metal-dependent hydrolase
MTFNVRYGTAQDGNNHWDKRKDFLVDTIAAFDPDLLGTQETLGFQRDFILACLTNLTAWGAGRDDGAEQGEMTVLFYRTNRFAMLEGGHFWLSEKPDVPGSVSWDSSLTRMASWVKLRDLRDPGGPAVLFMNTHFDHKGAEARLQAAKLIRAQLAERGQGCRVVVTGDFNAGEGSEPYAALFGAGGPVIDAFRVAHPERKPDEGSFNGFDPSATKGDRIDWIGVSTNWTVQSVTIDRTTRAGRTPSDHFPILAVLAPRF